MVNKINLNSTGSLWMDTETGIYYSYNTPMNYRYKNLFFVNDTYYSVTTRKHQAIINRYYIDTSEKFTFHYCPYGNHSVETAIRNEITMLKRELDWRNEKRKTSKNQSRKEFIKSQIKFLETVLYK